MKLYDLFIQLKTQYGDLKEVELSTISEDKEWDHEMEQIAAILAIIKNPLKVSQDPHTFSEVVLALNGVIPDFHEYEYIYPEMIALTLEFIDKIKDSSIQFIFPDFEDDVKYFIALCCIEDGVFFLKNNLTIYQNKVNELLKEVYGNPLTEEEFSKFDSLWNSNTLKNINSLKSNDFINNQIKINLLIKEYIKDNL